VDQQLKKAQSKADKRLQFIYYSKALLPMELEVLNSSLLKCLTGRDSKFFYLFYPTDQYKSIYELDKLSVHDYTNNYKNIFYLSSCVMDTSK
jgi:hypothetical protein